MNCWGAWKGLVRKETDAMEGITQYYPKEEDGAPKAEGATVYAYVYAKKGELPKLYLETGFYTEEIGITKVKLLCQLPGEDIVCEIPVGHGDSKRTSRDEGTFVYVNRSLDSATRSSLQRVMEKNYQTDVRFYYGYGSSKNFDAALTGEQKKDICMMLVYHYLLADENDEAFASLVAEFAPDSN